MLTKQDAVRMVLGGRAAAPRLREAEAFAPANIALCKYWGKRNEELNLPVTSSLSISLGRLGSRVRIRVAERGAEGDTVSLNGRPLRRESGFCRRLTEFFNLFRDAGVPAFEVAAENTIPTAAGFASSASGFAAVIRALDGLMGWGLGARELSILARLGSGSACRSMYDGLVEWRAGDREDGMDSFAEPLATQWPELRIGLLVVSAEEKGIGSRAAMKRTVESSPLYKAWPGTAEEDLAELKGAIEARDFERLGRTAEGNAMAMHASMLAARPPVLYWAPETLTVLRRVWLTRESGIPVYATMDAGPNVKLILLAENEPEIVRLFPDIAISHA